MGAMNYKMKNTQNYNIKQALIDIKQLSKDIAKPSKYILLFGFIMSIIHCLAILTVYYFACEHNTLFDSIHIIRALYDNIPAVLLCSFIPALLWDLTEREYKAKKK